MRLEDFHEWTERLAEALRRDERVIGLVMLGSSAETRRIPDEWSDHDFFVMTRSGVQEGMRQDLSWLPDADEIVLRVRETDHGLKVLYGDGHLIEFAVFDMNEITLARVNDYRVVFEPSDGQVSAALRGLEGLSGGGQIDRDKEIGLLLSLIVVGSGRVARGEVISGGRFIKDFALSALLRLLAHDLTPAQGAKPDNLDPFRRVEECYPMVASQIHGAMLLEPFDAAWALLDIAEAHLRDLPREALEVVRRTLSEAMASGRR